MCSISPTQSPDRRHPAPCSTVPEGAQTIHRERFQLGTCTAHDERVGDDVYDGRIVSLQVSPRFMEVLNLFEDQLANPAGCVAQMALIAQLLGERRVCKLNVQLMSYNLFDTPCMIYCLEQEAIGAALEKIRPMV